MEELLALTGQPSVLKVSLRVVMRAAKLHLGRDKNEAPSCMAEGRIRLAQDVRATRCNVQGILPPQDSSSTLGCLHGIRVECDAIGYQGGGAGS
jgi:hypothetical protein